MTTDNNDKTVFKQQPLNPERTVLRPAPGGRGASQRPAPAAPQPAAAAPQQAPAQRNSNLYRPEMAQNVQNDARSVTFDTHSGINPIVNNATTLITVFEKTRQSMSHPDVGGLHKRLIQEIRLFETRLKEVGIKPEIVLSVRYTLCAALDEAVLNTPWGSESAWPQRTLLSVFHNETAGGEKFFQILDRMLEYPAENLDILEFIYILLSLGFEGKYRVIHRGRDKIEQLRDELFSIIRRHRGEYERSLSPHWHGLGRIHNSLASYIPFWVVASILAAVLLLSYSGFRVWLYDSSTPVVAQLDDIAASAEPAKGREQK
jgi:type VI secretion system protein ImpK